MADQYFYGTGRRKTAIARVRLYPDGFHGEWNYTIRPHSRA